MNYQFAKTSVAFRDASRNMTQILRGKHQLVKTQAWNIHSEPIRIMKLEGKIEVWHKM